MKTVKTYKQHHHDVPVFMTAITDLNIDCLKEIFSTLTIKELLSVAEANTSLVAATQATFQRNFSKFVVEVSNEFEPKSEATSLSVKLVTYFGEQIRKLKVVYHKKYSRFNDILETVILDRCKENLSEIEIVNGDELVFHKITKPFQGLLKISFVSSNIPDVLLHFEKWFPKATVLELKEVKIDGPIMEVDENTAPRSCKEIDYRYRSPGDADAGSNDESNAGNSADSDTDSEAYFDAYSDADIDAICYALSDSEIGNCLYGEPLSALAKHYPTVEHFAISNVRLVHNRENRVRNHDIVKFIQLNPQLKSLFIESDDKDHEIEDLWAKLSYRNWSYDGIEIEYELLDYILQYLTSLENVHLIWKTGKMSNSNFVIYFEKLSTLTIEYYHIYQFHCCVMTDNIDVLNIVEKSHSSSNFANLLKDNLSARVVTISGIDWNNKNAKSALKTIAEMPNLKELQLSYKSLKREQIISLLNSCKSLSVVTLHFVRDLQLFDASSKQFDAGINLSEIGWKISSYKKMQLVLKRVA